jgi:acetyltransferase
MKAYNMPVPAYAMVSDLQDALQKAQQTGYPLVLKLNSKTVSHKTEVGGVVLDIRTPEQLTAAYQDMLTNLKKHGIDNFKSGEGLMIQSFLNKGREVIMGLSEDPGFGKMMMLGLGGIYVEIFKDVQFRLLPVTGGDVKEMLGELKSNKILHGFRGKPGVDLNKLEEVVLRLSQLATDFPEITELDINPFMANPGAQDGGNGGMAVDSRIIIR